MAWVTDTITLIYGEHDAVLVDAFLSVQHSKELIDWLAEASARKGAISCDAVGEVPSFFSTPLRNKEPTKASKQPGWVPRASANPC